MTDALSNSGRNILVFADGTGNEGGLLPDESQTNVYKLFRATRSGPDTCIDPNRQLAFYISGIGTPKPGDSFNKNWLRHGINEAVGGGLTENITKCYVAIISAWQPGDRIYLFGFSRGAYTVRCLAHVLEQMGIPTKRANSSSALSLDPKKLYPVARSAVRILYRLGMTTADTPKRDRKFAEFRRRHGSYAGPGVGNVPYFVGVWDTVAAVGWNRLFPAKIEKHLPKGLMFVRHAMAIDEYRADFARAPWGSMHTIRQAEVGEPCPFEQIWFAGNHADIGGSYPENESRLSDITLDWMTNFISKQLPERARVLIDPTHLNLHPAPDGMMHDECMVGIDGSGIPWMKKVRLVDEQASLHESVFRRLALASVRNFDSYGPYRPANLSEHPKAKQYWTSSEAD